MSDVRKVIEISWAKPVAPDDIFHADPLGMGRSGRPAAEGKVWYGEDLHMHGDRLAITGAISDPRARTIGPRRFGRRRQREAAALGLMMMLALYAAAWGLVYVGVWAVACLWRWAEPLLTVIGVGAAMAAIVWGLGTPG